jgi:membrane protease YdiL (CAAX protease family)
MKKTPESGVPLFVSGLMVVVASMFFLFTVPAEDFIGATFASMTCMILVTYFLGRYRGLFRPRARTVALGLVSAALLYLVFYAGNLGVTTLHPLGLGATTENSIYSLIASPSNPLYLQVAVLAFDAVGYESYFRGILQTRLEPRTGMGSVFLVALFDALLHVVTLNPLWVVTTFIADSAWGLSYYYSKDLTSNVTSHFVWDIVIFVLLPIH